MDNSFLRALEENFENQSTIQNVQKENSMDSKDHGERRQSSSNSRQRYSLTLQSKLENLNYDLRYAGFKQLSSFCFCTGSDFDLIYEIMKSLLNESSKLQKKSKQNYQAMIEMKNYNRQIERENDQLKESKAQAIKDRDHLMEKNRQLIRECKEKDEKLMKEKDSFAKERKGWVQKEDAIKNYSRIHEEKMRVLEQKLKKIHKLEKVEFRNTFEINVPIYKSERPLMQKQYEQMIARTIESHKKQLEEENSDLKSLMKEFFGRLQKIAENIDHEELESSVRQQIVQLPLNFSKSKGFPETIRKILRVIEEKLTQIKAMTSKSSSITSYDSHSIQQYTQSVNRLKGFYSMWEEINEKRNHIVPNILSIVGEMKKISKLAEMMEYEYAEPEGNQLQQKSTEIDSYINQKMQQYSQQLKRISSEKLQIQNLQEEFN